MSDQWLNKVNWTQDGLVPVIAQEAGTGQVLMFAWMKLWHKGEESGHVQKVHDIRLDCDEDVVLLTVEQIGGIACHTGRHSCFFQKLENESWVNTEPVLKDPAEIYKK